MVLTQDRGPKPPKPFSTYDAQLFNDLPGQSTSEGNESQTKGIMVKRESGEIYNLFPFLKPTEHNIKNRTGSSSTRLPKNDRPTTNKKKF